MIRVSAAQVPESDGFAAESPIMTLFRASPTDQPNGRRRTGRSLSPWKVGDARWTGAPVSPRSGYRMNSRVRVSVISSRVRAAPSQRTSRAYCVHRARHGPREEDILRATAQRTSTVLPPAVAAGESSRNPIRACSLRSGAGAHRLARSVSTDGDPQLDMTARCCTRSTRGRARGDQRVGCRRPTLISRRPTQRSRSVALARGGATSAASGCARGSGAASGRSSASRKAAVQSA